MQRTAPIIGVVFQRLFEVYYANYIEIHRLCIILWLYTALKNALCTIGFSILQRQQRYVKLECRDRITIEIVRLKYSYRNFKMTTVVILKVSVPDR